MELAGSGGGGGGKELRSPLLAGGGSLNGPGADVGKLAAAAAATTSNEGTYARRRLRGVWALVAALGVSLAAGLGLVVGGLGALGTQWYDNEMAVAGTGLPRGATVGVGMVLVGVPLSALAGGLAVTMTGMHRRVFGANAAAALAAALAIGFLTAAWRGGGHMLPSLDYFYLAAGGATYDMLTTFLGLLILAVFTLLGAGALCVAASILKAEYCGRSAGGSRHELGTKPETRIAGGETDGSGSGSAPPRPFQRHGLRYRLGGILLAGVVMGGMLLLSSVMPPHWQTGSGTTSYWGSATGDPTYIVNSISTTWTFTAPTGA